MNLEELLKPFKDASAAWEIDIAQILDEYIEESDLHSEFIDFRSIATLLKGSTNVFARKVDYIHDFATRMFSNCSAHPDKTKGERVGPSQAETGFPHRSLTALSYQIYSRMLLVFVDQSRPRLPKIFCHESYSFQTYVQT